MFSIEKTGRVVGYRCVRGGEKQIFAIEPETMISMEEAGRVVGYRCVRGGGARPSVPLHPALFGSSSVVLQEIVQHFYLRVRTQPLPISTDALPW
jgi:hypothetical protein